MKTRLKAADAVVYPLAAKTLTPALDAPSFTLTCAQLRELIKDAQFEVLEAVEAAKLPAPDLVDAVEMARRIGISRTTLHRLRVDGMPAIPVGDTFRYRPAAVIAWLESRGTK